MNVPFEFRSCRACAAVLAASASFSGCGGASGPALSQLNGTVTLNGTPLGNARVVFQPLDPGGTPSVAETSPEGRFELVFNRARKGVLPGNHKVKITTARVETDDNGVEKEIPELLPPKYHQNTELTYEVKPGENKYEVNLEAIAAQRR